MTNNFFEQLNKFLKNHNYGPLEQDEDKLFDFIKMQIKSREVNQNLEKAKAKDFELYKKRVEKKIKIIELFLFYIKESLITPYNLTLTHRERDGINQLLIVKITNFLEHIDPDLLDNF